MEHLDFLLFVHPINPRVIIPKRTTFREIIIPAFSKELEENFIKPRLSSPDSNSISFDLWMSRGFQESFNLLHVALIRTIRMCKVMSLSSNVLTHVVRSWV